MQLGATITTTTTTQLTVVVDSPSVPDEGTLYIAYNKSTNEFASGHDIRFDVSTIAYSDPAAIVNDLRTGLAVNERGVFGAAYYDDDDNLIEFDNFKTWTRSVPFVPVYGNDLTFNFPAESKYNGGEEGVNNNTPVTFRTDSTILNRWPGNTGAIIDFDTDHYEDFHPASRGGYVVGSGDWVATWDDTDAGEPNVYDLLFIGMQKTATDGQSTPRMGLKPFQMLAKSDDVNDSVSGITVRVNQSTRAVTLNILLLDDTGGDDYKIPPILDVTTQSIPLGTLSVGEMDLPFGFAILLRAGDTAGDYVIETYVEHIGSQVHTLAKDSGNELALRIEGPVSVCDHVANSLSRHETGQLPADWATSIAQDTINQWKTDRFYLNGWQSERKSIDVNYTFVMEKNPFILGLYSSGLTPSASLTPPDYSGIEINRLAINAIAGDIEVSIIMENVPRFSLHSITFPVTGGVLLFSEAGAYNPDSGGATLWKWEDDIAVISTVWVAIHGSDGDGVETTQIAIRGFADNPPILITPYSDVLNLPGDSGQLDLSPGWLAADSVEISGLPVGARQVDNSFIVNYNFPNTPDWYELANIRVAAFNDNGVSEIESFNWTVSNRMPPNLTQKPQVISDPFDNSTPATVLRGAMASAQWSQIAFKVFDGSNDLIETATGVITGKSRASGQGKLAEFAATLDLAADDWAFEPNLAAIEEFEFSIVGLNANYTVVATVTSWS